MSKKCYVLNAKTKQKSLIRDIIKKRISYDEEDPVKNVNLDSIQLNLKIK